MKRYAHKQGSRLGWMAATMILMLTQGCAMMFPPTLHSKRVETLPAIDGQAESAWETAEPVRITATGNTLPDREVPVEIRSLNDGERVAFLIRWEDDTKSDRYRQYAWYGDKDEPELDGVPDDQLALKFNISGSMRMCMLSGKPYAADIWQWRAARTNATGYAEDRYFIVRPAEKSAPDAPGHYTARNGHEVEIVWQKDEGTPLVSERKPDLKNRSPQPTFVNREPTHSQADIRAKAQWAYGIWTLEMARPFETGFDDDITLKPGEKQKFSIAVFDESEGQVHANTWSIKLEIE